MITLLSLLLFPFAAPAAELSFEPNTAVWGIATQRKAAEGALNPRNVNFRTPEQTLALEARPDWNLAYGGVKLTARPRLIASRERVEAAGRRSVDSGIFLRWSEGFAQWQALESLSIAYGLQNFQWGPAESASPSNRIFRDTVQVKDAIYSVKGHHLARATFTPSNSFSEVLLVELSDNGDGEAEAYEAPSHKALLKSELSWDGGAEYGGLVLGWRDRAGAWFGEYLNLEPFEGFSLYADASHQAGTLSWYPAKDSTGRYTVMAQSRRGEGKLRTFLVTGARYAFENGNDWRLEHIFQENGWTSADRARAQAALTSADPIQYILLATRARAAFQPGLDFPGRSYLFSSIRFPNVFDVRDWNLYFRFLRSLQDSSSSGYASTEHAIGERGTLVGSVGAGFAADGQELRGTVDLAATLAYRHAW